MRMEEEQSHMTEKILNLTLEIIYLLTGENFPLVKSGDHVTVTVLPCDPLKPERYNMEKILEVTKKMMKLLTGESGILSATIDDVKDEIKEEDEENAVMEKITEGHKDLYEDSIVRSSSYRKTPERCPRPLYSQRHPTQGGDLGDCNIVVKEESKEEDEEYGVEKDLSEGHKETMESPNNMNPPERCDRFLYSHWDPTQSGDIGECNIVIKEEYKEEDEEYGVEKEPPSNRNPPERSDGFLHSHWDPTQGEHVINVKIEDDVEETYVRDDQQLMEEEEEEEDTPTQISTGLGMEKPSKNRLPLPPGYEMEDEDMTGEMIVSSAVHGGHGHSVETPSTSSEQPRTVSHSGRNQPNKTFSCPRCEKTFSSKSALSVHHRSHTGAKTYPCSECGKCFIQESQLVIHQRSHTVQKLYSCPQCGEWFASKPDLVRHQRTHRKERPYSCLECGKCFFKESALVSHYNTHTREKKQHSCSECGKSFSSKSALVKHQRSHTRK